MSSMGGDPRVRRLTRRELLWAGSGMAFGALLTACAAPSPPTPTPAPAAKPAEAPKPAETPKPTAAPKPTEAPKPAVPATVAAKPKTGTIAWMMRSSPVENKWEENVVLPRMKELYPQLNINLIVVPGDQYAPKVNAGFAADDPPDVFHGVVGLMLTYYYDGKLLDLTPYIQRDKVDMSVFGGYEKDPDMYRDGKQWSMPWLTTYGTVLYYNKKLFDQAGLKYPTTDWEDKSWTWDKAIELAKALTKNYGTPDAVYGIDTIERPYQLAYLFGGDCWEPDHCKYGIAQQSRFTDPEVIDGAQLRQDLMHKHKVQAGPAELKGISAIGDPFKTGRLAMNWTGGWGYWVYSDVKDFQWGVAPTPWKNDNKPVS